jgi:hypothetical protein
MSEMSVFNNSFFELNCFFYFIIHYRRIKKLNLDLLSKKYLNIIRKMAESVINLAIGGIISTIYYIKECVELYKIRNENVLELHREIQNLSPCVHNLMLCPHDTSLNGNIQRLAILIAEIHIWIKKFGQMHCLTHFFFSISHKTEITEFYLEIQNIKMNLGFNLKIGNFQSQSKLNQQMDDLLESLKQNESYTKIKELYETQKDLYESKLLNHKAFIEEMDQRHNALIQEHNIEIQKLEIQIQDLTKESTMHTIQISNHEIQIKKLVEKQDSISNTVGMIEISHYSSLMEEKISLKYENRILSTTNEKLQKEKTELEEQILVYQKEKLDWQEKVLEMEKQNQVYQKEKTELHQQMIVIQKEKTELEKQMIVYQKEKTEMQDKFLELESKLREHIEMNPIVKQMIMYKEKLPEYIEEIPFGTKFIFSNITKIGVSPKSTGYIDFLKKRLNFQNSGFKFGYSEWINGPLSYLFSKTTQDNRLIIWDCESSCKSRFQWQILDEHAKVIISASTPGHNPKNISWLSVYHPTLDYKDIRGQVYQVVKDTCFRFFMYPYSRIDKLNTTREICYETDFPDPRDTILKFLPYHIKIFYLLDINQDIEFGYFNITGPYSEVKMVKCVDKNIYVEESEYPLCNFKVGEFIELCNDKTGLLEIRFEIPSQKLFFYEQEKIVGMKIISDNTFYFVKYF